MLTEKLLDCSWERFEEIILEKIGSDFTWRIRPRDTEENRQAVMESILSIMTESNGTFPAKGNAFIEPYEG